MTRKATMADLARASGYSKTAISFAFNQPEKISAEAYSRIMEEAKKLDYVPDPMARNLSLGRHMSIGFLLPQKIEHSLSNPYLFDVIKGIGNVCESAGYTLTIIPPLHSSFSKAVRNAMVDGIITMGISVDPGIDDVLRKRRIPIVSIDGRTNGSISTVNIDDRKACYEIMKRALELGHRSFAFIALMRDAYENEKSSSTVQKRLDGYKMALEEYGLDINEMIQVSADATYDDGMRVAEDLLKKRDSFSCVVSMADITAFGFIDKAEEKGIHIPEDLSLISFDGLKNYGKVKLTTVNQPASDKGKLAAEHLIKLIGKKEEKAEALFVPFFLTDGNTLRRST